MGYDRGYLPKVVYRQKIHNLSKYFQYINDKELNKERIKLRKKILARYEI